MLPEIPDNSPEAALSTILQSYPVNQDEVDVLIRITNAANEKVKYIDPVGSLLAQAGWEAEKKGVKTLPMILAAVAQIEKSVPAGEKQLTPQRYIEYLAKGETGATAKAFWDNTISHEEQLENAALHAAKADKLYKILLNKRNGT